MIEEAKKLTCDAFALALLINEHTEYCVFANYSGHVDNFEIRFAESKTNYLANIFSTELKTGFEKLYKENPDDKLSYLKAQIEIMKRVLDEGEIPYEELEEHIEQIVSYTF